MKIIQERFTVETSGSGDLLDITGRILPGRWQQIVLAEFDTRSRRRDIVVQVLGRG